MKLSQKKPAVLAGHFLFADFLALSQQKIRRLLQTRCHGLEISDHFCMRNGNRFLGLFGGAARHSWDNG